MKRRKKSLVPERTMFREGRRLYLRAPQKSDLPYLVRWFNDYEVTRFLNRRFPMTEGEELKWIETCHERMRENQTLIIVFKGKTPAQDRPIGTIGLNKIERESGLATTGAAIGEKDYWENGYGTEAKMLLLDYAFNTLNLRKIYSHTLATNPRSQRYSEKCGYKLEATLPQHHYRDGKYVDDVILAVYADEWRELWAKTKHKYLPKRKKKK